MKEDSTTDPATAESSRFDLVPKTIVEIQTDSGITGIGETGRGEDYAGVRRNAEFLTGRNALDFNLTRLDLPDRAVVTFLPYRWSSGEPADEDGESQWLT